MTDGRVFCAYQPHTYSRTKGLFDGFVSSLRLADKTVLADIYPARETDTLGMSSALLAEHIGNGALYLDSFEKIAVYLLENAKPGDVILTMGAGDITALSKLLLNA